MTHYLERRSRVEAYGAREAGRGGGDRLSKGKQSGREEVGRKEGREVSGREEGGWEVGRTGSTQHWTLLASKGENGGGGAGGERCSPHLDQRTAPKTIAARAYRFHSHESRLPSHKPYAFTQ